jgi:hypothetical protein
VDLRNILQQGSFRKIVFSETVQIFTFKLVGLGLNRAGFPVKARGLVPRTDTPER